MAMPSKIAIVGTRSPTKEIVNAVRERVLGLSGPCVVVSGGCRGVDRIAIDYAKELGFDTIEFKPQLKKYGSPEAYHRRNQLIADFCDIMYGFPGDNSTGTYDAMHRALTAGKKVFRVECPKAYEKHIQSELRF